MVLSVTDTEKRGRCIDSCGKDTAYTLLSSIVVYTSDNDESITGTPALPAYLSVRLITAVLVLPANTFPITGVPTFVSTILCRLLIALWIGKE